MPTENRSSNTEKNAPCPFCNGRVDPEGWLRGDGMRGPECESCGATAPSLAVWNSAEPAPQPHPEPIAWMVGTAFWWTKEEAERDAAATGLPIIGLGPMADAIEIERLRAVIEQQKNLIASLRDELVESHTIDASAEPSGLIADPCKWSDQ